MEKFETFSSKSETFDILFTTGVLDKLMTLTYLSRTKNLTNMVLSKCLFLMISKEQFDMLLDIISSSHICMPIYRSGHFEKNVLHGESDRVLEHGLLYF